MSSNGDDGIEDILRELAAEVRETNDLLRRALTMEPEDEQEVEEGPVDLWSVGSTVPRVRSEEDYRIRRAAAAQSDDVVRPAFSSGVFTSEEEKTRAHMEMFLEGYHSIQSMESVLSKASFADAVRMYAKREFGSAEFRTMLDFEEPGPGFFGLPIVEERRMSGQGSSGEPMFEQAVVFEETNSPFALTEMYGGNFYHPRANPSNSLGLIPVPGQTREGLVPWEPVSFGPSDVPTESVMEKLATSIVANNERIPDGVEDAISGTVTAMERVGRPIPGILSGYR